jgi:hypothetical protein
MRTRKLISVTAFVTGLSKTIGGFGHWYRLERAQDNFAIADIFTLRRLRAR